MYFRTGTLEGAFSPSNPPTIKPFSATRRLPSAPRVPKMNSIAYGTIGPIRVMRLKKYLTHKVFPTGQPYKY